MDVTTTAGGGAALLLRPAPAAPAKVVRPEGVRRLRAAADPAVIEVVDAWTEAGGITGEQLLCVADLLRRNAERDPAFAEVLLSAAADDDALGALAETAESFHRRGQWGAAAWCAERYIEIRGSLGTHSVAPRVIAPTLPDSWPGDRAAQQMLAELAGHRPAALDPASDVEAGGPADDLVATVLTTTERGDLALSHWEDAAGTLIEQRTA